MVQENWYLLLDARQPTNEVTILPNATLLSVHEHSSKTFPKKKQQFGKPITSIVYIHLKGTLVQQSVTEIIQTFTI